MTSAREQIFAALDALLGAVTGVVSYRREPRGGPGSFPALELLDDGQSPIEGEVGSERLRLDVIVQGYVQDSDGATAHAAMNTLHATVVEILLVEPPLGGLIETIEIGGMRIDVSELATKGRYAFAQDFTLQYSTPRGDPSQFA